MGLKVAFIGTHGTGKTTLAYELCMLLKKKGFSVGFIEEVARNSPLPVNEGTSLEAQEWVLAASIQKEIEAAVKNDIVVCDRSVLDNFAYMLNKYSLDNPRVKMWKNVVYNWLNTYEKLFFVPINDAYLHEDGFRSINRTFQEDVDQLIRKLLLEFKTDRVTEFSDVLECVKSIEKKLRPVEAIEQKTIATV